MSNTSTNGGGFMDRVVGKAKQVAGTVVGDEGLKREGQLHEEKADAAVGGTRREAEATAERERADVTARERELAVEEREIAVEEAAEAREERLERERQQE